MGCGAVQSTIHNNRHEQLSHSTLQQLLPKISIHAPLLLEEQYLSFSSSLRQNQTKYIMEVGSRVSLEQSPCKSVLQKWRILIYGLDKGDYAYRRCLGFEIRPENTRKDNGFNSPISTNQSYHEMRGTTIYHNCFEQIEKDLNRTFSFQNHTQQAFERVLKRIANHFPSMGYTQGVNFVVGYLLLLGYSEVDTFWMFTHMAMSRHFLLLGLYEDGFPLAGIMTLMFRNILERADSQLHHHIYNSLMLDDSIWIFKWFITLFIYSFPLQVVKHSWDVLFELGVKGIVFFAVSLVLHLKNHLLECGDPCDISEFLTSLKDVETFNRLVNIKIVLEGAYELRLLKHDLDGVEQCKLSFYQEYFKILQSEMEEGSMTKLKPIKSSKWKNKDDTLTSKLHFWYLKLLEERVAFAQKNCEREINQQIPQELKDDYEEMQKSVKILTDKFIQNQSQHTLRNQSQRSIQENSPALPNHDYFHELVIDEPNRLSEEHLGKIPTRISYDIGEEIDELEGESDSNAEELDPSQEAFHSILQGGTPNLSINLDKFPQQNTPKMTKINIEEGRKALQCHRKKELSSKANQISSEHLRSGLGLAGQNIIGNISITNSQYSSIQSNHAKFKPKKQKQNLIYRYAPSKNHKTEVNSQFSHPSNEFSSEHESSVDHRTEKDSVSGFTHRDSKERPSFGKDSLIGRTQQDVMFVSHGPQKKNTIQDAVSEIEIYQGDGLFKKKKRNLNRNSIVTSINRQIPPLNLYPSGQNSANPRKNTYNDEESLESVLELSSVRRTKRTNERGSPSNVLFDIESIK